LQERECERVGGSGSIKVDVRIIAATNRDLLKAMRGSTFREDLYYRLNVFPITLPPLRERPEDLPLLVHFFVNKFMTRVGKSLNDISRQTMERLVAYPWPGNVRELENILERAVILSRGSTLEIGPELLPTTTILPISGEVDLATLERNHIRTVLEKTAWVIEGPSGAARILGLHPNTLRSRMKKLGVARGAHDIS
jgi:transcriptional regulator with GAF, ATPase, and Fis domain